MNIILLQSKVTEVCLNFLIFYIFHAEIDLIQQLTWDLTIDLFSSSEFGNTKFILE